LSRIAFKPARSAGRASAGELLPFEFAGDEGYRLVFVNGFFAPHLSSTAGLTGLCQNLGSVAGAHPERLEHLAQHAAYEDNAFTALNTAFLQDGCFLQVPAGKVVERPIHLLFLSTATTAPTVSYPRNLIVVGNGSQVTIVESYIGQKDAYFTNAVTEIVAGENAVIDHYKLQQEGLEAFHVATLQIHQSRNSNFSSHFVSLGCGLVRNDVNAVLDGEGCECTLNGLYMGRGSQHVDNHTFIDHAKPHCTSHELYKGILKDRARGVFNGKIYVHQDAQKTDAKQTNQTLLLSDDAVINTKPQLEIYADDVKCTHGATVGQLSDEALFYLRSRGIGQEAARGLLTYAFANDIIGRIKVAPIRARLEEVLLASQGLPMSDAEEVA
jgi:Fe-S cluster assembly protein SufD